MGLEKGDCLADLGCGPGDYSIYASPIVGRNGRIYSLDRNEFMIGSLKEETVRMGLENVIPMVSDITERIPLEDGLVDICLLSTVLHIPDVTERACFLGCEIGRILRPGGRLVVIEVCVREGGGFGIPRHLRISPEETESLMALSGFHATRRIDFEESYMFHFEL